MPKLPKIALRKKKADNGSKKDSLDMIDDLGAVPKISYGDETAKEDHVTSMDTDPTLSADNSVDNEKESSNDGQNGDQPMEDNAANWATGPVVNAEARQNPEDENKCGEIKGRVTMNKMFVKKSWLDLAWYQQNETTILFFKNREDFLDWKHKTRDHHLYTDEQRDVLVKKKIDFSENLKLPKVKGYTLSNVEPKEYTELGAQPLYQFKLDCWMALGPVTEAALGSSDKQEAQDMHDLIFGMYTKAFEQLKDDKEFFPATRPQCANGQNLGEGQNHVLYT